MSAWPAVERWLRALPEGQPPAVVIGGGAGALSYARSLGRRRIPILLVDAAGGIAGRSRYVHTVTLRSPRLFPDEWVEALDRVGSRLPGPGVLLPTNDVLCKLAAENADELERHFRFILPSLPVVRAIVDKRTQYQHAQAAGIPIPATHFPESLADAERVSTTVRYPCLFKPYESAPGRAQIRSKALQADDREQLISCFRRFATDEIRFMVQEFVPGEDRALFSYYAFWDADGREHGWMTKQKLRQFPLIVGSGSMQVSMNAPEVADLSRKLLRSFGYRGLVSVEFKLDARDGTYRLIEINPRTGLANQLAVSAGVDFPYIVYRYLAHPDSRDAPPAGFRTGVKWVNEDLDLQAFLALRERGELTFWRWARSVAGARSWAVATPRDPAPFLFQMWGHVGRPLRNDRAGADQDIDPGPTA